MGLMLFSGFPQSRHFCFHKERERANWNEMIYSGSCDWQHAGTIVQAQVCSLSASFLLPRVKQAEVVNLKEEGFTLAHNSSSQSIIEESGQELKQKLEAETTEEWSLLGHLGPCFPTQPRTTCPMGPFTVDLALLCKSLIKMFIHRHSHRLIWSGNHSTKTPSLGWQVKLALTQSKRKKIYVNKFKDFALENYSPFSENIKHIQLFTSRKKRQNLCQSKDIHINITSDFVVNRKKTQARLNTNRWMHKVSCGTSVH